jgi:transcriptional regulator with XRE-family HTH domain
MMQIEQCRAARALLDWSAQHLAERARIGVATVRRFESGSAVATGSIEAMKAALNAAGIIFLAAGGSSPDGGAGVRMAGPTGR